MQLVNLKKTGDEYGGDNLLFTIFITDKRHNKALKGLDKELNDKLLEINEEEYLDCQWGYHMNGDDFLFETTYIDKGNEYHKIENNKVIITDDFLIEFILDDCKSLMSLLLMKYQGMLWSKIDYEDSMYEELLDCECLSERELCDLEDLSNQTISVQEFANRQGYEWNERDKEKERKIQEIREIIDDFAKNDQYSANNEYVKALYKRLRKLEGREQIEEENYEPVFIGGSDVPIGGYYE